MAVILPDSFYVNGTYLDANVVVSDINGLLEKVSSDSFFLGMEAKMPEAFYGVNEIPYPIDFWSIPNGEDIKWEVKTMPSIESEDDLELFKTFTEEFKTVLGYYPMTVGFEFLVNGNKYVFGIDEKGAATFIAAQTSMDDLIADTVENAVEEAVNKVTSGASEAFDTLQEIEAWINANSGNTPDLTEYVKKDELSDYAKKEDIPLVEGLATEAYVDEKVAAIEMPSVEGLASEQFVVDKIAEIEIPSVEGLATEAYVNEKVAAIEVPSVEGLATEAYVDEKVAAIEVPSVEGLASEQFVTDKIAEIEIPSVEGLATEAYVNEKVAAIEVPSVEGLATEAYVDEKVAAIEVPSVEGLASEQFVTDKIAEIEIPSVEGLASEEWVKQQNYLTEHQSLDGLATEEYVDEKIAAIEIPSVEGLATEEFVINKIAEAELGGEDVDLSGYATKTELQEVANSIPSVEGLASEQFVTDKIAEIEIPSVEGLATEAYVNEKVAAIEVPSVEGLASEEWVKQQNYLTEHQSLEGLASENYVDEKIAAIEVPSVDGLASEQFVADRIAEIEIPSVEGLASEQFVTDKIAEIEIPSVEGLATEAYVDEKVAAIEFPETDLTGYATEQWVEEKGYLTEHQDISSLATKEEVANAVEGLATEAYVNEQISAIEFPETDLTGYATEQWVEEKGYLTEHQSLEGYATEEFVTSQGYITEHQDISGLATKDEVANAVEGLATEEWVEGKGYLTEHQSLEGYAKESWVTEYVVSAVTGGQVSLDGYATEQWVKEQNYITEHQDISGLATKEEVSIVSASIKTVVEELLIPENAKESLDTIEEISAWIQSHPEDAATMNAQIQAISAVSHTHENKEVLDGITEDKVVAWDSIEENVKTWVGEQGYLTEHQDISGLATKDEVANALEGLATEAWVVEQGFLTEHQDISNLATKDEVADAVLSAQTYADNLVENLKPYSGGTAVEVVDYTINVNVAEGSFLEVNEENELTVTGVTLDAAVTSKDITIEGGQWATAVKTVFTGGTVPAGTTWQSFLESMLCVEKFDTSYSMSKTFTVSCGTLGEGITGATNNSSVEVGTKVSLKSFEANPTTASQSYTVSTFDYGYKLGEDGTYNKNTSFKETLTPSLKASNDALTATFTTFVDESGNTIAKISGNTSMGEVKMRVMDGTNKVVIAQTGDTYTASSAVTAGTIYVATNLKNYYKSDKKTPNTYTPSYASEDKTATASTTYTVTGYRNTFYGTTSNTDTADATFIRTLTKSNKAIAAGDTISFDTNSSDGHLRMVIASPRTVKSVKNQTGTQDLTALLVGTKATVSVGGVDNFAPISYNVYDYTWKGAFGNETWIITFA